MQIVSCAFTEGQPIPRRHTCEDADTSPPLVWRRTGYGGPCPPIGRHRYFFKLYALDRALPDLNRPTKPILEKAMQGHVLAEAVLVGTYQKGR